MKMTHYYPHVSEFLSDIADCPQENIRNSSIENQGRTEFTGTPDYETAHKCTTEGYDMEEFNNTRATITSQSKVSSQINEIYDVQGSYVDVGRFLEGEPECMVDFAQAPKSQALDIFLTISEPWLITAGQMRNRAAIICCLVDDLEKMGVRCRIHVIDFRDYVKSKRSFYSVRLKNFDEPLSVAKISGASHPSFFRRIAFRHTEKYYVEDARKTYGKVAVDFTEKDLLKSFPEAENVLIIESAFSLRKKYSESLDTLKSTVAVYEALIKDQINKLGIDIELQ